MPWCVQSPLASVKLRPRDLRAIDEEGGKCPDRDLSLEGHGHFADLAYQFIPRFPPERLVRSHPLENMSASLNSRGRETTNTTFEWDLHGLKDIFDSSRDDEKSPLIASSTFGGGRWQLHFYASAARAASCSLYLAAIPTAEELDAGRQTTLSQGWKPDSLYWHRKGPFSFSFEIKSLDGTIPIVARGPHEPMTRRDFSSSCSTWGYPQYVRRTEIFGERAVARGENAVKVVCTLTQPAPPSPLSQHVLASPSAMPSVIIDTMAELFDNPSFSDVLFEFPASGGSSAKLLHANKGLLIRGCDYFQSLFEGGFAEDYRISSFLSSPNDSESSSRLSGRVRKCPRALDLHRTPDLIEEDDSDAELDFDESEGEVARRVTIPTPAVAYPRTPAGPKPQEDGSGFPSHAENGSHFRPMTPESLPSDDEMDSPQLTRHHSQGTEETSRCTVAQRVVIRDTAYITFASLVYALYTNTVMFAPLASTFDVERTAALRANVDFPFSTRRAFVLSRLPLAKSILQKRAPFPCSPKSLYKLADKYNLPHIKSRALDAIKASLTPNNVAIELFGPFSTLFPDVRSIELEYMLNRWEEVSHSDAMTRDLNPFEAVARPTAPSTRGMSSRSSTNPFTATSNHELFIHILQSLRPKSRRTRGAAVPRAADGIEHDEPQPTTATSERARERFSIS